MAESPPPVSLVERVTDDPKVEESQTDLEIEMPAATFKTDIPDGIEIEMTEDGGVTIDLDPTAENNPMTGEFYRNLATELDDSELGRLSSDLVSEYDANKSSRKDWEDAYANGLELLGFNYEERTQPFRGATGVTHPLLAEAATQFQAQAFNAGS